MTEICIDLFRQAQFLLATMVLVIIGPGLVVGLCVAIFQAATQINEQTLSFLPRLVVTLLTIVFTGPWLIEQITDLIRSVFASIPMVVG